MKITRSLEFQSGSKEEKLPCFSPNFPYIASQAQLDYYKEPYVPWHWHRAIEYTKRRTKILYTKQDYSVSCRLRRYGQFQCTAHDQNSDTPGKKCAAAPYL